MDYSFAYGEKMTTHTNEEILDDIASQFNWSGFGDFAKHGFRTQMIEALDAKDKEIASLKERFQLMLIDSGKHFDEKKLFTSRLEIAEKLAEALNEIRKTFERQYAMASFKDRIYLDAVLAIIETKSKDALTLWEKKS